MKNVYSEKEKRVASPAPSQEQHLVTKKKDSKDLVLLRNRQDEATAAVASVSMSQPGTSPLRKKSMPLIQPWMVVLGDTHARPGRTTIATSLLRDMKDKYRKEYKGGKKTIWIPLAIEEFRRTLPTMFEQSSMVCPREEMGMVLVKCTPKAMEARTERILIPNVYGYEGDEEPTFGTAKWRESLEFFLESRDAPTLANELEKHRKAYDTLQKNTQERPPATMMMGFAKTLVFFQEKLEEASRGDALAEQLLESLKPINSLNKQWKTLISNTQPLTEEPAPTATEKVHWEGVTLQVVPHTTQPKPKRISCVPTFRKHNRVPPLVATSRGGIQRIRTAACSTSKTLSTAQNQRQFLSSPAVHPSHPRVSPTLSSHAVPTFAPIPSQPPETHQELLSLDRSGHQRHAEDAFDSLMDCEFLGAEYDDIGVLDDITTSRLMPDDWKDIDPPDLAAKNDFTHMSTDWFNNDEHEIGEVSSILYGDTLDCESLSESIKESTQSQNDRAYQPKAFAMPSWLIFKIAAVASLLGLHTFRSHIRLNSSILNESLQPGDMSNLDGTAQVPCPSDTICTHIMEAIYPYHPEETKSLLGVPGTCQNWAREWLSTNRDILEFSPERIRQRYALAVFYCETDGVSWTEQQLWMSDLHECDWQPLIKVDPCNRHEQLQILRNEGQQMRGRLPPELGMITSLWELSLGDNMLYGTIPTSLSNLSSLDTLSLSTNLFEGEVPAFVWKYEDLITLDLSHNHFSGSLPNELHWTTPNLQNLHLSFNFFHGTIPPDFGMMAWQRLCLDGNQLEGTIPTDINADQLKILELHDNHFSGTFPAESFATEYKLEVVSLFNNDLVGSVDIMCPLVNTKIGSLSTLSVDLEKVHCTCCSGDGS